MPKGRSRHLNMQSVPKLAKRDRHRPWLNEFLPPGPGRLEIVAQIRSLDQAGTPQTDIADRFNLPLHVIKRLCYCRTHQDPCPKHDGSGLLPCSPSCRGCAWESEQISKLGPAPPAMSDRVLSSAAYRS